MFLSPTDQTLESPKLNFEERSQQDEHRSDEDYHRAEDGKPLLKSGVLIIPHQRSIVCEADEIIENQRQCHRVDGLGDNCHLE